MRRLLLAVMAGIIGALVLHIVIILALPFFAVDDVYSRIRNVTPNDRFGPSNAIMEAGIDTGNGRMRDETPYTNSVLCRFSIADRPVHLSATGTVPFWSLVVFDTRSNEIFSMNDRTAEGSGMNVALASPLQMIRLRESVPAGLAQSVLVESSAEEGYVVLRTVIPDQTFEPQSQSFLGSATCRPIDGL